MIAIALYQPEIPPNTGNIMRLAANTGASLHLIEPLGFELSDKQLRRAGLDYGDWRDIRTWPGLDALTTEMDFGRVLAISTKGARRYTEITYQPDDLLLFGPETRGLPASVLTSLPADQTIRIPMLPSSRSINLANAVSIVVYEAWRQQGFADGG